MKKAVALLLALSLMLSLCGCSKKDYERAIALYNEGQFSEAQAIFSELGDYEDSLAYVEKCKVEGKYVKKEAISKQAFKDSCVEMDYEELLRKPEKNIGIHYKFSGKVSNQPEEENTEMAVRCYTRKSPAASVGYIGNMAKITYRVDNNEGKIIKDDTITVWCVFEGLTSFNSLAGTYDIPVFTVYYYSIK